MSSTVATVQAELSIADLQGSRRRRRRERTVGALLRLAALVSVAISVAIVVTLVGEAWSFFSEVDKSRLWTRGWAPRRNLFDIRTLLAGTLIVSGIAMAVATPLGMGAAVYLSEYASPRVRRVLKPIVEILAGIPSVVLGFFALTFVSPEIVQRIWPRAGVFNLLSAGIGVGILTIPLVASVAEDALRSVPGSLREAAYGIGARKKTTVLRVVLPAAVSGLVAAFILAVSRTIGETMVVAIAAGATGSSLFTVDPLEPGQTMTAAIASLATGTDQVAGSGLAYQSLFFVGFLLFVLTLLLNVVGDRFVRRVRRSY